MTQHGIVRTAREVFLTLGAVLGVVCIVVTAAGFAFGVKPLIFRSGSMSPAIHTGDMAISRTVDASALERGDIVSVVNTSGERVTHRLVNAARQGDARQLTLKGDANKKADAEVYTVTKAERVLFTIPKAGYVVNAATSPVGLFLLGLYVAVLLLTVFGRGSPGGSADPPDRPERSGGGRRRASRFSRRGRSSQKVARMVAVAVVGTTLMVATPAIAGPWTDDVPVTDSVLTAYTVPKSPLPTCNVTGSVLSGYTATISWAAVTAPFAFTYTARLVEASQNLTVNTVGANREVKVTSGLLGSLFGTTVNVRINTVLPGSPTWISVNTNQPLVVGILGLSLTCGTAT